MFRFAIIFNNSNIKSSIHKLFFLLVIVTFSKCNTKNTNSMYYTNRYTTINNNEENKLISEKKYHLRKKKNCSLWYKRIKPWQIGCCTISGFTLIYYINKFFLYNVYKKEHPIFRKEVLYQSPNLKPLKKYYVSKRNLLSESNRSLLWQNDSKVLFKIDKEFEIENIDDLLQPYTLDSIRLTNNKYFIIWDGSISGDYNVYGTILDTNSTINTTSRIQISPDSDGDNAYPSISTVGNDNVLVVWENSLIDLGIFVENIHGQFLDFNGNKIDSKFKINSVDTSNKFPHVTNLDKNKYLAAYQSLNRDGSSYGIYTQMLYDNGTLLSTEKLVNNYTEGYQGKPKSISLSEKKFGAFWESYDQDGDKQGIFGQLYHINGSKTNKEFQINTYTTGEQSTIAITSSYNGSIIVEWISNNQDGIFGQRLDNNCNKIDSEFQVNSFSHGSQFNPDLISLNDNYFINVWEGNKEDGNGIDIYAQIIDKNNNRVGDEFQVNSYTTDDQVYPNVKIASSDKFIVFWLNSVTHIIYGQYFKFGEITQYPTFDPTSNPSNYPTHIPSTDPTYSPSINPSNIISNYPTQIPSTDPTYSPSINPSSINSTYQNNSIYHTTKSQTMLTTVQHTYNNTLNNSFFYPSTTDTTNLTHNNTLNNSFFYPSTTDTTNLTHSYNTETTLINIVNSSSANTLFNINILIIMLSLLNTGILELIATIYSSFVERKKIN